MTLNYVRMTSDNIRGEEEVIKLLTLPEISKFVIIDRENYLSYVTSRNDIFFYKIYFKEKFISALHIEKEERTLYVSLAVASEYQKRGIGCKILEDIQKGRLVTDFKRIEVYVDRENRASVKLFEKMGFVFVEKAGELIKYVYDLENK